MVWHWIKKSAKKRRINFDLPKQEFFDLLACSGYLQNSGRLRDSLTLDRIDGDKGYTMDNIRVIPKSDNSAKYHDKIQEFPGQFNEIEEPWQGFDDNNDYWDNYFDSTGGAGGSF